VMHEKLGRARALIGRCGNQRKIVEIWFVFLALRSGLRHDRIRAQSRGESYESLKK
jgi:hypothetical protein